ncbi:MULTISPECIES: hypothetical protein [Mucilaginibacter]|uniref:DUF7009 family protein n=1 Tax=Mucilaginibacter TaxID=423349 RepID=UPI002090606E|nr:MULTISPECIES: hypothetical protein [Mucilaginibacter]MCO5934806.1 hypothetical protein [Mucilaginibacter aurantiaciroseus]MEB0262695.1 hypothetical protein [Mucilaginibacter sp. 10I4]MEB0279467.1 hypothetical protein [Mucilaginibacter sp. 10B2]MEB0300028.1 hypothetical protein [Mucilaginibacter sp. 5C4]WPX21841.1 hypothetical protein RHM67_11140 [Mucilaginibacter sp. 5C4]
MKIRIKNNGLRYRLTRNEVATFANEGIFKEKVQIGDGALIYILQRTAEDQLSASFKNNIITMLVPEKLADEWTNTDQVGFEHKMDDLHLLVEKDFTCLDEVEEDQSDNYPNPLAAKR